MRFKEILLSIYLIALIFAAVPFKALIPVLGPVSAYSARALARLSIIPGLDLFHRLGKEDRKSRGNCLEVKNFSSQKLEPLFRTRQYCNPPSFQFFADIEGVMFYRFLEDASIEHYRLQRKIAAPPTTRREKALVMALGDYFCSSAEFGRTIDSKGENAVTMTWTQTKIDYVSGDLSSTVMVLLKWSCSPLSLVHLQWAPFIEPKLIDNFQHDRIFE